MIPMAVNDDISIANVDLLSVFSPVRCHTSEEIFTCLPDGKVQLDSTYYEL